MHVAIIMDGNGRWAVRRGKSRSAGHREGAKAVRKAIEAAARAGVDTLTLYAFSSANWTRPQAEVAALMRLFRRHLLTETSRCLEQGIRINVIGRRDRLDAKVVQAIERSESLAANCNGMHLRIAIDYSARHSILAAAKRAAAETVWTEDEYALLLDEVNHSARATPPVDLLIRTGGEQRLSDFLLWECAYAELHFSSCLWPDFDESAFKHALHEYSTRERRFGGVAPLLRNGL